MAKIIGASWITGNTIFSQSENYTKEFESIRELHSDMVATQILSNKIKNFGRLSDLSKQFCLTSVLAMKDAGIDIPENDTNDIGVIGTDHLAATKENETYFKDYVESGRTLARGNLFVYTLPSSPLSEAAIALKLSGPLLYYNFTDDPFNQLIQQAETMLNNKDLDSTVVLFQDSTGLVSLVLQNEGKLQDFPENCTFDVIPTLL